MAYLLQNLNRPEAEKLLRETPVAIVPIGSTEQHGPHLPLGTDIFLAEELANRVSEKIGAVVFPSLNFGYSWVWRDIPGTVSLPEPLLQDVLKSIAYSVERYGVKLLVFLNGHEANNSALKYAIRAAQDELNVKLLGMFYPGMEAVYKRHMESATWGGMFHADEFETSLMLASAKKKLVAADKAVREYPEKPPLYGMDNSSLGDISSSGVYGDPTLASAEKGEAMFRSFTEKICEIISFALKNP